MSLPLSTPDAHVAIQLAIIACAAPNQIPAKVAAKLPGWRATWVPAVSSAGHFAFVARRGVEVAIAVRGSVIAFTWDAFYDWLEDDFNLFSQVAWPAGGAPDAGASAPAVSAGSMDGFQHLLGLRAVPSDMNVERPIGLADYLTALDLQGHSLLVTGHSLGAGLVPLVALHLAGELEQVPAHRFRVLTFAGPTSGNAAFAALFDRTFANAWRYFVDLDVVPRFAEAIPSIAELYDVHESGVLKAADIDLGEGHRLGGVITEVAKLLAYLTGTRGPLSPYAHTNQTHGAVELRSAMQTAHEHCETAPNDGGLRAAMWLFEAGQQHSAGHYQRLIAAQQVAPEALATRRREASGT